MAAGKKSGRKSQASNDFLEPRAPESVSATNVPSGRAYNDGRADVTFSLPANSPAATSYTVTSSPGSYTATGASSPLSVTGLQSNTAYTFTVIATNASGNSLASSASASITATTVPATPSAPSATAQGGASNDDVSWSAPADGGSAITSYDWQADDGKSGNQAGTSVTVGQEAGSAQSYRVRANNANGSSAYSSYSAQLTSFSFAPFGFAPFGAFGFTPFGAFGFTPFGAFGFTPFGAFGFTPWGGPSCVHEDTLIRTPNGDVAAKDIKVDDFITSVGIQEIELEGLTSSDYDWRSIAIPTATNTGIVEVRVTASEESTVQEVVYFNGESETKFSLDHPMFLKGDPNYVFILAGGVKVGDILIKIAPDGSIIEVPVTSINTDDTSHKVYKFSCEPQDWFISGDYLTHNK
jgi:hypothetical protein